MSPRNRQSRTAVDRRRTSRASVHEEPPARLRLGTLGVILGVGAVATVLGIINVHLQFSSRDYAIETRRIQELANLRRDEIRTFEAELGAIKRDENLRAAATGVLGMIEPPAESVSRLPIDPAREGDFRRAADEARERLAARRNEYELFRKEVF